MMGILYDDFDSLKNIPCDLKSVYFTKYIFTDLKWKQDINSVPSLSYMYF